MGELNVTSQTASRVSSHYSIVNREDKIKPKTINISKAMNGTYFIINCLLKTLDKSSL